jgi:hypothetical protein
MGLKKITSFDRTPVVRVMQKLTPGQLKTCEAKRCLSMFFFGAIKYLQMLHRLMKATPAINVLKPFCSFRILEPFWGSERDRPSRM